MFQFVLFGLFFACIAVAAALAISSNRPIRNILFVFTATISIWATASFISDFNLLGVWKFIACISIALLYCAWVLSEKPGESRYRRIGKLYIIPLGYISYILYAYYGAYGVSIDSAHVFDFLATTYHSLITLFVLCMLLAITLYFRKSLYIWWTGRSRTVELRSFLQIISTILIINAVSFGAVVMSMLVTRGGEDVLGAAIVAVGIVGTTVVGVVLLSVFMCAYYAFYRMVPAGVIASSVTVLGIIVMVGTLVTRYSSFLFSHDGFVIMAFAIVPGGISWSIGTIVALRKQYVNCGWKAHSSWMRYITFATLLSTILIVSPLILAWFGRFFF